MSRRVLITGGAGFIGCHLARKLLSGGADVAIFDNLHPQVHLRDGLPPALPAEVQFLPGDVASPENWRTVLRHCKPDAVVHLAAETGTGQSLTEAYRHASVNVCGTAAMLDAFSRTGQAPAHIVLASSRAVYGDGAWRDAEGRVFYPPGRSHAMLTQKQWDPTGTGGLPAEPVPSIAGETHPNPISIYGATKLAQEHLLLPWTRAFGVALTVLRLQNVYGPGQTVGNPYTGVLTIFGKTARMREPLDVYEDGKILRDFVHVEDVVQAMARALDQPHGVRMMDVGSGAPTTIHAVATLIAEKASAPKPVVSGKFRDGDVRAAACSIEAARRLLGYAPAWTLEKGLDSLLQSIEEKR